MQPIISIVTLVAALGCLIFSAIIFADTQDEVEGEKSNDNGN
jgi:FtsH-binding integral membrane protein